MKLKEATGKIIELDGVRGIACLLVLIHHYITGVMTEHFSGVAGFLLNAFSVFFLSGVDLFFVLSGFLVGGIILDNAKSTNFLKVFFIRRACRIFPVYFLLIATLAIGLVSFQNVDFFKDWLLKHPYPIWTYLTFLQSYAFGFGNNSGPIWAAITWSVSVEEQFYLLMPFALLFLGARKVLVWVIFGLIAAPLVRLYLVDHIGSYAAYMFFPGRMDTLFWGVLLAFVWRDEKLRQLLNNHDGIIFFITFVLFISVTSGYFDDNVVFKFSFLAIFYMLLLWIVVEKKFARLNKFLRWKFFTFTGSISYSIYMFHQLINGVLHGVFFNSKPVVNNFVNIGVTILATVLVYFLAYISLKYIELPIRSYGANFKYLPPSTMKSLEESGVVKVNVT